MTAPLSNKADPADEGEEIARTLYGVCATDRYVPSRAFLATIVKDTIVLHRFGRAFSAFAGNLWIPAAQALRPLLSNR